MFGGSGCQDKAKVRGVTQFSAPVNSVLITGIIAGIAGGVLIDTYLIGISFATLHSANVATYYQSVAAIAVGKVALADPNSAWLGAVIHFALSIAWGIGYVYAALQTPAIAARPVISGVAFGFVVYLTMQIVAVATNTFRPPDTALLVNGLVAYMMFFGLPIALITYRARLA
jgi:uncharacterized membrane protein YagU involved in acid resistance